VVDGTTGRPIPDATVYADTPASGVATTSDGRFVLREVKAGRLFVAALKPGYLQGVYGQTRPNGIYRLEPFGEGEKRADIVVKLWRYASISGRVVDEAGEPVIGVDVRAARRVMRGGEWRFEGLSSLYSDVSAETDDRGEYRFSEVVPGDWLVAVTSTTTTVPTTVAESYAGMAGDPAQRQAYQALGTAMSQIRAPRGLPGTPSIEGVGDLLLSLTTNLHPAPSGDVLFVYPSQYYAAADAPGRAQLVALTPGQERAGVDFALRPARTVRVSGVVEGPAGPVANLPLRLIPSDTGEVDGDVIASATMSDAGGRFTFLGVVPGTYSVRVIQVPVRSQIETQVGAMTRLERGELPSEAPTYWARQELTVANADVSNLMVTLSRGFRLVGRVEFEGLSAGQFPADFRGGQLRIEGADGRPLEVGYPNESIALNAAQFQSIEFPPGRYFVRTPGYAWRLVSAMSGGRDVSETPVVLADRNVTDLVVTFSKENKFLRGMVRSGRAEPETDAFVVAFPLDRQGWTGTGTSSRRFQIARTSAAGSYELVNLPAGDYFLVALDEDPGEAWKDPQSLGRWSAGAARVTVGSSSASGPDLPVRRTGGGTESEVESVGGPFIPDDIPNGDQARDTSTPLAVATGRISGVVQTPDGTSTTPLRRAVVTLTCANPRVGRTFVTDDMGTFAFDALPRCRYTLTSTKSAYLTTRYGASGFDRPATPIDLADGQNISVRLTMHRGGVITGVIRDGRGEPMPNAAVQIMRVQFSRGERRLESVADSLRSTDSSGAYRVYGLPPGEFVVGATAMIGGSQSVVQLTAADVQAAIQEVRGNSTSSSTGPPASTAVTSPPVAGYAPTFYPRTHDPTRAAAVKVEAGEERRGIDITLDFVRMSRVSLMVTGTDGQPPGTTQARLTTPLSIGGFMSPAPVTPPTTVSGGRLTLPPVPPGQYTIAVSGSPQTMPPAAVGNAGFAFGAQASIGFPQWAIVPISVSGEDIEISVRLERGKTVTGRVILNGVNPPADFAGIKMGLAGPTMAGVGLNSPARQVANDGGFVLENVIPAKYRIVNSPIRGWTIASVLVNGQEVADRPADISSDLTDVVVTFTDKTTDFSGILKTASGQPAPDHQVIVFPADRSYWVYGTRRIASLRPSTDGRFVTTTLPAGEYFVAVVTDVANEEWFNPDFLATLEPVGVRVTVKFGEKTVRDLTIR